ncbi:MAG: GNAT family N-acetyltransferase [Pseudoxanthomonas sp.]
MIQALGRFPRTFIAADPIMPSKSTLDPPRLVLTPFGNEHFDDFYSTCICDASVMSFHHAYRAVELNNERRAMASRDFVDHFSQGLSEHGYICWALMSGPAFHLPAGTFLGWCGILTPALSHSRFGPEIAYMLARSGQGFGLATEAARSVLADAWSRYALSKLHAVVDSPNRSSRRVLQKLGFQLHGQIEVYGSKDMLLYTAAAMPKSA